MIKKKIIIDVVLGTLLSILVFFSISFITFLDNIGPLHYYGRNEAYHLEIGFPFTYYYEFFLSGGITPNSGWNINHLFYNCLISWIVVTGLYLIIIHFRKNRTK